MAYRETFVEYGKPIDAIMGFTRKKTTFDKHRIRLEVACGLVYEIDVEYLIAFSREFGFCNWWRPGETGEDWSSGATESDFDDCYISRTRMVYRSPFTKTRVYHGVRLHLSNGLWTSISWDSLLCDCEPSYRLYGGFSAKSIAVSANLSELRKRTTAVSLPVSSVNATNFGVAKRVDIVNEGLGVRFEVPAGFAYIATIREISSWLEVNRHADHLEVDGELDVLPRERRVTKVRRLKRGSAVRLRFVDGTCWDVPMMSVLRYCDDRLISDT